MYQATYYIEKASNSFADNLAAFGLARILEQVIEQGADIVIADEGYAFEIRCSEPIREATVKATRYYSNAPFLITIDSKTSRKVVKGTTINPAELMVGEQAIDYEVEKEKRQVYFEWRKSIQNEGRQAKQQRVAQEEIGSGPPAPTREWEWLRAINPGMLQTYNGLVEAWLQGEADFGEMLEILLQLTAVIPNDSEGASERWNAYCQKHKLPKGKDVTASQLLNPAQGKGTNAPKAAWREPNNIKNFWLMEYLKLVGMREAGITKLVKGSKDRKTYVLAPNRLGWNAHRKIIGKFREAMLRSESALRMDSLAVLYYTKELLKYIEEGRETSLVEQFLGRAANDLVMGLETATYKSLGNAAATMNLAALNVPGWVRNLRPETLQPLANALDEHISVVRGLEEEKGDQYNLLLHYREFLSANDLTPFFEFTQAYSSLITQRLERRRYIQRFSTQTLEVLFMNSDDSQHGYASILRTPGFQNIAYAIRHSTVIPQYQKTKGRARVDIRYGLGNQLTRKAAYPQDFLAELSDFLQAYNAENAQLSEKGRNPARKSIRTSDIEEIAGLIDRFGSKLICNMLVAYGYALTPKEEKEAETGAAESSLETEDDQTPDGEEEVIEE